MLLQSRGSHTTVWPQCWGEREPLHPALCQFASQTSSICKPNQPPQTAQSIWATYITSLSEMTQWGTKPKNETNKRLTHAHDSASGFYLKCPITVAKPTKAALHKPLSTGMKADPVFHCHHICAQGILCAAPQGCLCCVRPAKYCRTAGGGGGFSCGLLVAP